MRWKFLSLSLYSQQMVSGGLPRHTLATRNTCTVTRTALSPSSDGQVVFAERGRSWTKLSRVTSLLCCSTIFGGYCDAFLSFTNQYIDQ